MTNGSEMQDNPAVTRILDLSREDPTRLLELERFRRPITVLFTDIEGSTAYFEKFGDISGLAMVHKFNDVVRKAVDECAGRVVKNIGDGIMATFDDSEKCVEASIEIQRRLKQMNAASEEEHRLMVRIGLHYGMGIIRSDNDVFGDVVNVASRIQSAALPGQILVSDTVQEKIASGKHQLSALGRFRLKGKSEERDLFEVLWSQEVPVGAAVTGIGLSQEPQAFQLCHLDSNRVADAVYVPSSAGLSIGRSNSDLNFPDAVMDSPHARLLIVDGQPVIEDLSLQVGVFVQLMGVHILEHDDTIMIGRRIFRFIGKPEIAAAPNPWVSPVANARLPLPIYPASLVLLDGDGSRRGERYPLGQKELRIGRTTGDHVFPDDVFMSRTHARLYQRGEHFLVEDLSSLNGTFVKARGKAIIPLQALVWIGDESFQIVAAAM
jgi:class 3 adenylate cyclase